MTSRFLDRVMVLSFGTLVGAYAYVLYDKEKEKSSNQISYQEQAYTSLQPYFQGVITGNEKIFPELLKHGYPGPFSDLRGNDRYVSSYNRMLKIPNYTIEKLTKESLSNSNASRKSSEFKEDAEIPKKFRASLKDYFRSGYDRGHLVPAADMKIDQKAMDETFLLTNISPQIGKGFNRNYWAYFERFCRSLAYNEKFEEVYIITGGLFLPKKDPTFPNKDKYYVQYEVIGNPPNVAVPTHFYKIILAVSNANKNNQELFMQGFVLPNKEIPDDVDLKRFMVPIDAIERASGMEFFKKINQIRVKELCSNVNCKIELPKLPYKNKETKKLN